MANAASFTLDFQADTTHDQWSNVPGSQISCNFAGIADNNCTQGLDRPSQGAGVGQQVDLDTTPFLLEKVTNNGVSYWHMVMGDPNADMAQEYYIAVNGSGSIPQSSSNGDGCYNNNANGPCVYTGNAAGAIDTAALKNISGNGWDPLAQSGTTTNANTGNGSANPNKVIMRQVTGLGTWDPVALARTCTGDLCQEFLKDTLAKKPVITQDMSSTHGGETVTGRFQIDMSNSDYLTATSAASITNTLDFSASSAGNFNQATDAQNTKVNGGQYTYTPGTSSGGGFGPQNPPTQNNGGSGGTFSKGLDPATFDYGAFRDSTQNAAGAGNQWK